MSITWLEPIDPQDVDAEVTLAGRRHPMRMVTMAAAAEVGAWSGDTPRQVEATFDALAGEWHTRHSPGRTAALGDALDRGVLTEDWTASGDVWLELGAGDGAASATIAARAPRLVAIELSARMLAESPDDGVMRVRADAAALPLDDHAASCVVLMNMLLFPTELDRVLAPDGRLLWLSSRGPATPIYLSAEQVAAALPGRWGGVAGQHGTAHWAVLSRLG
ncbi:methyltransferase domain-containing protein [Euzebya tangerina]|uniref:methyltransferase domain-containing protein n=1 Tax=Euzebya tangerina TaxID=591198 RepID=UPI000E3187A9|nr:methyltransferase domain-containing protein [Euzebya tangerina]